MFELFLARRHCIRCTCRKSNETPSQTEVDMEIQANIRDEIPHFSGRKLKAAGCRSLSSEKNPFVCNICAVLLQKMWTRLINAFICHVLSTLSPQQEQRCFFFDKRVQRLSNKCLLELVWLQGGRAARGALMINDFMAKPSVASAKFSDWNCNFQHHKKSF